MHPVLAAALVIGALVFVGGPILYWIFFRMDEGGTKESFIDDFAVPLSAKDIELLQEKLGLTLPIDYTHFLMNSRPRGVDVYSLYAEPEEIIEETSLYRSGFEGLPKWPKEFVCIGSDADDCPYVLNVATSEIISLNKGNLNNIPTKKFLNFKSFLDSLKSNR
ncbi:MAG: SMI1/KNR4 family protein [Verrucomicrobiota bacterium JB022]|nr:SMI1/KNR4 family protein [Verrucomicrobiota bacterium JB022]